MQRVQLSYGIGGMIYLLFRLLPKGLMSRITLTHLRFISTVYLMCVYFYFDFDLPNRDKVFEVALTVLSFIFVMSFMNYKEVIKVWNYWHE
jgi:hypothetical protein